MEKLKRIDALNYEELDLPRFQIANLKRIVSCISPNLKKINRLIEKRDKIVAETEAQIAELKQQTEEFTDLAISIIDSSESEEEVEEQVTEGPVEDNEVTQEEKVVVEQQVGEPTTIQDVEEVKEVEEEEEIEVEEDPFDIPFN